MTEALTQACLQSVVGRVCDAGDEPGRRVDTAARRIGQSATGIQPPLIGIARRRNRLTAAVNARNVDRGIAFDEARQFGALGADIADLKQQVGTK